YAYAYESDQPKRALGLEHRADAEAPVALAGHLAQAAVEEAIESAAEPHADAGLALVAPARHLRPVLTCVGAEDVGLLEVRHRPQLARQLEHDERLGRHLPREVEHAARDAREAEADRRADLQVVADEHTGPDPDVDVVGEVHVVAERRADREV